MAYRGRGLRFNSRIDQNLLDTIEAAARAYKGPYDISLESGYRPYNPKHPGSQHGRREAIDFALYDPKTGVKVPWYQNPAGAGAYQQFANHWYGSLSPEQQKMARWGGYFGDPTQPGYGTRHGEQDWMHLDLGRSPEHGMHGGDWAGGFKPEAVSALGLSGAGGIGGDALVGSAGGDALQWTINPAWPAGMRNNNPGNIKFVGQAGTTPSKNTDQGDPQAVYATPEAGMSAMYQLLTKKYRGGKVTPNMIIAGQGGWTPGNTQAAANVARYAGIGPDDDIGLNDPVKAARFMRALMLQEHGDASKAYSDAMINAAISGTPVADPGKGPPLGTLTSAPGRVTPATVTAGGRLGAAAVSGAGAGAGGTTTATAAGAGKQKPGWGQKIADALAGAQIMPVASGQAGGSGIPAQPGAANVVAEAKPVFDPATMQAQRDRLAQALARLNQNQLWG